MRLFPRTAPVGLAFGSVLVLAKGGPVEVTTFRSDGPYLDGRRPAHIAFADELGDAQRRDLTINALFLDPESGEIIDHVGGRDDLAARRIRTVASATASPRTTSACSAPCASPPDSTLTWTRKPPTPSAPSPRASTASAPSRSAMNSSNAHRGRAHRALALLDGPSSPEILPNRRHEGR